MHSIPSSRLSCPMTRSNRFSLRKSQPADLSFLARFIFIVSFSFGISGILRCLSFWNISIFSSFFLLLLYNFYFSPITISYWNERRYFAFGTAIKRSIDIIFDYLCIFYTCISMSFDASGENLNLVEAILSFDNE